GVPLHIVDTAGLRETEDTVERIGIARTWAELEKANVIIHLQDARARNDELDTAITSRLPAQTPVLKVFNKIDLLDTAMQGEFLSSPDMDISSADGHPAPELHAANSPQGLALGISAKTGAGLDMLRQKLL